mmetsp:Transcript_47321/g.88545  ORF Transcript_47321/g.88545 Transcript_47321/m.88545 type:complete len:205 (-) Transcript_47321:465-1079(-)
MAEVAKSSMSSFPSQPFHQGPCLSANAFECHLRYFIAISSLGVATVMCGQPSLMFLACDIIAIVSPWMMYSSNGGSSDFGIYWRKRSTFLYTTKMCLIWPGAVGVLWKNRCACQLVPFLRTEISLLQGASHSKASVFSSPCVQYSSRKPYIPVGVMWNSGLRGVASVLKLKTPSWAQGVCAMSVRFSTKKEWSQGKSIMVSTRQ